MNINNTVDGKCSKCGACCSALLPVSNEEIKKIKRYIAKNDIKCVNRNSVFSKKFEDVCPFLSSEKLCNIYDERPEVCRNFSCSEYKRYTGENINHRNKHIINMLTEFYSDAFIPNEIPNLAEINKLYEGKKRKVYGL